MQWTAGGKSDNGDEHSAEVVDLGECSPGCAVLKAEVEGLPGHGPLHCAHASRAKVTGFESGRGNVQTMQPSVIVLHQQAVNGGAKVYGVHCGPGVTGLPRRPQMRCWGEIAEDALPNGRKPIDYDGGWKSRLQRGSGEVSSQKQIEQEDEPVGAKRWGLEALRRYGAR